MGQRRTEASKASEVLKPWKTFGNLNFGRWAHDKGVLLLDASPSRAAGQLGQEPPRKLQRRHSGAAAKASPAWSCKVQVVGDECWENKVPTLFTPNEPGLSDVFTGLVNTWGEQVSTKCDEMNEALAEHGQQSAHTMLEVQGDPHDTVSGLTWVPPTHRGVEKQPGFLNTHGSAWLAMSCPGHARAGQHLVPCDGMGTLVQHVAGGWCVAMWPSTAITSRWGQPGQRVPLLERDEWCDVQVVGG